MENQSGSAGSTQHGVYYAGDDYAGFWKRLLVDVVDFTVLIFTVIAITVVVPFLLPGGLSVLPHIFFWSALAVGFVYLVLLKRSQFRTLGYMVAGIRIVNIQGQRPSIWSLTIRALFAVFGPLNVLVDILWITSDERRQALRDKFAHTYVVRDSAAPAGKGAIVYAPYTIFGVNFLFVEVRPFSGDAA